MGMSLALTKRWNMDHKVLCFALLYFGVQAYGGEITDLTSLCSDDNGQPIAQSVTIESVTMENCDQNDDDVCLARKGVDASGQIKFTTTEEVETLTCSVSSDWRCWTLDSIPWRRMSQRWLCIVVGGE